jgi:hypothetical protein
MITHFFSLRSSSAALLKRYAPCVLSAAARFTSLTSRAKLAFDERKAKRFQRFIGCADHALRARKGDPFSFGPLRLTFLRKVSLAEKVGKSAKALFSLRS